MHTHPTLHSRSGFTLVELIIGMTIFAVSMTAILALLSSTIDTSIASRQEIVASNILREEIELIKNLRNSNVRSFAPWDRIRTEWVASSSLTGAIYIVESDFSATGVIYDTAGNIDTSPVYMKDVTLGFPSPSDLEWRFLRTKLSSDAQGRFTHLSGTGTKYASYVIVSPLIIDDGGSLIEPKIAWKNQWYTLDARVIVKWRYYREYDLKTVITDWKK